jgi:hypothetical protein
MYFTIALKQKKCKTYKKIVKSTKPQKKAKNQHKRQRKKNQFVRGLELHAKGSNKLSAKQL